MVALKEQYLLSSEDYLELEEKSQIKHEYIDGEIYAMAGTTDSHNTIALNFALLIRNHFRGNSCRVYFADIKTRIEAKNRFYYPDLLVTCDRRDRETPTYKCFPKLIIEVLSDSTEARDRGDKFQDYQTLESLEEYILVNSKRQQVEIFRKQAANRWQFTTYSPENPRFTIASIDLEIAIADLYEDVEFEEVNQSNELENN